MEINDIIKKFTNVSNEEVISEFAKRLLEVKKLENVDKHIIRDLQLLIEEKVTDTINMALILELPEEKFAELELLSEKDKVTAEEVTSLIMSSGIDVNGVVARTLAVFRDRFIENVNRSSKNVR